MTKPISVRIPDVYMFIINKLVQQGTYKNNTEVILAGIELLRDRYQLNVKLSDFDTPPNKKAYKMDLNDPVQKEFLKKWKKSNIP